MSLVGELQRRNVVRVVIAYLAGAWLLIQIAETLLPVYGFGDGAIRIVVAVQERRPRIGIVSDVEVRRPRVRIVADIEERRPRIGSIGRCVLGTASSCSDDGDCAGDEFCLGGRCMPRDGASLNTSTALS